MDIGERIREARKTRGLTQEEVARRAGMSLKGMAYIERGHIEDPHFSSLSNIAHALGMSIGELMEEPALTGKAVSHPMSPPLMGRARDGSPHSTRGHSSSKTRLRG
ncbi:MAG: helix-turn-helix transcriptional regulator [Rubrobacter sp.]|nr:helix-turn-helix transcriptional regulator [Rubrobacter sp.]